MKPRPKKVLRGSKHSKHGKKTQRDSTVTHNFFNPVDGGGYPGDNSRSHNNTTESLPPGDSDDAKSTESDSGKPVLLSDLENKVNNLTPEDQLAFYAAMLPPPPVSDPKALSQALELACKQIKDQSVGDQSERTETFELDPKLDKVAKTSDRLCRPYEVEQEHEIASLAGLIGDLDVTASDSKRLSDDPLAAELDIHNLNICSKIMRPLDSGLCQVQQFNIKKRIESEEESYQALRNDERKRHGEDVPAELPSSTLQEWNDSFKLTESVSKPSKKKEKKTLGIDNAIDRLLCTYELESKAIQEIDNAVSKAIQDIKNTISVADKPIAPPTLPANFTYKCVAVPKDIPNRIRRRFFDADFALEEIIVLIRQKEIFKQPYLARNAFSAWHDTSYEAWKIGKRHIHEMPFLREYEYNRILLQALYYIASRQEVKILEFYGRKGAPPLPQAMKEAFQLGSLSLKKFEEGWETRRLSLEMAFPSVNEMVAETDAMSKNP